MLCTKLLLRQARVSKLMPKMTNVQALINSPFRNYFRVNNPYMKLLGDQGNRQIASFNNQNNGSTLLARSVMHSKYQTSYLTPFSRANFSVKMDKVRAKMAQKKGNKKYKMKTHKGARDRFYILGGIRTKAFQFKSSNARHLMRNKSKRNKIRKRQMKQLECPGDIRRLKRLFPYYRKMQR